MATQVVGGERRLEISALLHQELVQVSGGNGQIPLDIVEVHGSVNHRRGHGPRRAMTSVAGAATAVLGVMAVTGSAMLYFFKQKKWL